MFYWRRDRDYSALLLELHRRSRFFQKKAPAYFRLPFAGSRTLFPRVQIPTLHNIYKKTPTRGAFFVNGGEIGIRTLGTPRGVQLISSQPHSTTLPSLRLWSVSFYSKKLFLQANFSVFINIPCVCRFSVPIHPAPNSPTPEQPRPKTTTTH